MQLLVGASAISGHRLAPLVRRSSQKPVVGGGIGFFEVDVVDQFLTLGPQRRRRGEFAAAAFLQQDGLHVGRIVGLVLVGPCDGRQDIVPAVETHQVQQPAQVDGGLDGPAGRAAGGIRGPRLPGHRRSLPMCWPALAATMLEGLQLMFGLADQLAALVAARVAGDFAALVEHTHVRRRWPAASPSCEPVGRDRVAIAVELDAGMGVDHGRHDFVRVERQLRQAGAAADVPARSDRSGRCPVASDAAARWPLRRASGRPAAGNPPSRSILRSRPCKALCLT